MKKYLIISIFFLGILGFRKINGNENKTAQISSAVSKCLPLLQNSSHIFLKNEFKCHSCHNQGIGTVAFALAKETGFAVSDTIVNEALDSTCHYWSLQGNRQTLAENDDPVAIVMTGNYDLWALSANHYKSNKMIELLARNIMRKQSYDGSWKVPGQRPPLEYYSVTATALAIKNIQFYMPAILHTEVAQRVEKARTWLLNNQPEANEEKAFQLLGLKWSNADKKIIAEQAIKLLAAQHDNGGWSQLDSLQTDAYATGQSLYALHQSGQLAVTSPAYQKGISYLISTQFADGSWQVKTRSIPFVPYAASGFPHDDDEFISAAGSNWAIMALMLAMKKE